MEEPRWLVDEMLGRLARYLRFLGYDTEYVRGATDAEVCRRAGAEGRRLVTRDRSLAARTPESILLTRTDVAGQMEQLVDAFPLLRRAVRFDRCSVCNGRLVASSSIPSVDGAASGVPAEVRSGAERSYACEECGHLYWEGSHTRSVRSRLERWIPERRSGCC